MQVTCFYANVLMYICTMHLFNVTGIWSGYQPSTCCIFFQTTFQNCSSWHTCTFGLIGWTISYFFKGWLCSYFFCPSKVLNCKNLTKDRENCRLREGIKQKFWKISFNLFLNKLICKRLGTGLIWICLYTTPIHPRQELYSRSEEITRQWKLTQS